MIGTYTHLEDYIFTLYSSIKVKSPTDLSIITLSQKLNIEILFIPLPSVCLDNTIIIDSRITEKQRWQSFCHELSHYLLHSGNQLILPKDFVDYQEYKANNFMYHAAIPTFMLDRLAVINVTEVQRLFNVEYDFALKRLEQYINNKHSMLNWNIRNEGLRSEIHIV